MSQNHWRRARETYAKYEERFAVAFFIGGFLFDLKMVERIDSRATIAQQVLYLSLLSFGLVQMFFEDGQTDEQFDRAFILKRWYYTYRTAALHFFFGTLLNMYTIFFFKSSSLLVSFLFLGLLISLLLANESHRFKAMGVAFKFALLAVCFQAFFACVVPIFVGHMGILVFILSLIIGCLPPVLTGWWIQNRRPALFERAKTQILLPTGCVFAVFLSLYALRLTPPVPLSIPFIGVYHQIERTGDTYRLSHQRVWWKIWQHGDQDFLAQKNDKIYVAFRIFSPTNFSDKITMRWFWKDNVNGWQTLDNVPIQITGGREEGFRGFGAKANYQPGDWRVEVETSDQREIGRIYFHVESVAESAREFLHDEM